MGYSVQSIQSGTWTPTTSGWSTAPTINNADYILVGGRLCTFFIDTTVTASNSTTTTITLPFASKRKVRIPLAVANSGSGVTGFMDLAAGSNVGTIFLTSGAGLASTGNKGFTGYGVYEIQ